MHSHHGTGRALGRPCSCGEGTGARCPPLETTYRKDVWHQKHPELDTSMTHFHVRRFLGPSDVLSRLRSRQGLATLFKGVLVLKKIVRYIFTVSNGDLVIT